VTRARRTLLRVLGGLIALLVGTVWSGNEVVRLFEGDDPSVSHGTPGAGSLTNGKRLPTRGANYRAYSRIGAAAGRNAVHSTVLEICMDAYAAVDGLEHRFVYGETGWPSGGPFPPHKTHQNGLAVDFMVPVLDAGGQPVRLPTHALNRWGYDLDFDAQGAAGRLRIDFDAVAEHLLALDAAARDHGAHIEQVIFAPDLQPELLETELGPSVRAAVRFNTSQAWVRHDEHYHVVFGL
jgi:penicillin-insensitive murein endopeptidase